MVKAERDQSGQLLCCPHACQGGTLPTSLLPAPCRCQPSQRYCHRAPTPCCVFTHFCMEVSVMLSHCGLCGPSLLCLEKKKTSLSTPGSIYPELEVMRGNCVIPKLFCKHSCSCTYLYRMPEIRSCPIREVWSLLICKDSGLSRTSEVDALCSLHVGQHKCIQVLRLLHWKAATLDN